jgi:2-iminoacetate synthase ThiH
MPARGHRYGGDRERSVHCHRRHRRVRRIQVPEEAPRDGFPDTLDMLLVCVEGGQALDAALARVALEVRPAHPVLEHIPIAWNRCP